MDCNIYLLGDGRRRVGCGGGGSVGCGGSFVVDGGDGHGGVVIAVIFIWFSPKKLIINDG